MADYKLEWINKEADQGPLFKIGPKDVYYREFAGERVVRLKAKHSPGLLSQRRLMQAGASIHKDAAIYCWR